MHHLHILIILKSAWLKLHNPANWRQGLVTLPTPAGQTSSCGPFEACKRKSWGEEAKLLAKYRDFADSGEKEASVFPTHRDYALKKNLVHKYRKHSTIIYYLNLSNTVQKLTLLDSDKIICILKAQLGKYMHTAIYLISPISPVLDNCLSLL